MLFCFAALFLLLGENFSFSLSNVVCLYIYCISFTISLKQKGCFLFPVYVSENFSLFFSYRLCLNRRMSRIRRPLQALFRLNLFADANTQPSDQPNDAQRDQVVATRVYLLLLAVSVGILALFTGLSTRVTIVIVPQPSIETYKVLEAAQSATLSCPCQRIGMPYSSFLSIQSVQHQVRLSN
jgi:hypothetical protein